MSVNMGAITGVFQNFLSTTQRLFWGKEICTMYISPKAVSVVSGQMIFAWSDNSDIGTALALDVIIVAAYCPAMDRWIFLDKAAIRKDRCLAMDVFSFQG